MKNSLKTLYFLLLLVSYTTLGQTILLKGIVTDEDTKPLSQVHIRIGTHFQITDSLGTFSFTLKKGIHTINVHLAGFYRLHKKISFLNDTSISLSLKSDIRVLNVVTLVGKKNASNIGRLNDVEGTAIYSGKKTEVIFLDKLNANLATNNMRQIYAKVPGVNIIENDAAGIQLSIATRGLNPNRTTEFNVRQNGYDIAADPIGYPESYYIPPAEAVERIEVVRGAASLQYGTTFGGMVNYQIKKLPKDKLYQFVSKNTFGSFGFVNTYNSFGVQRKNKTWNSFVNFKRGDGWRENTGFTNITAYTSCEITHKKWVITPQITYMRYYMKQPGGLTDKQYAENPQKSFRDRNWFTATWIMPAMLFEWERDSTIRFSSKFYGLIADRGSVGNLNFVNQVDTSLFRMNLFDRYFNIGNENRITKTYNLFNQKSVFLIGTRVFLGSTKRKQAENGNTTKGPEYNFENENFISGINMNLYSQNFALFMENLFRISPRMLITPGIRAEYIVTSANGFTSNEFGDKAFYKKSLPRMVYLMGLGAEYKFKPKLSVYSNISRNYSPISFGDVFVKNSSFRVDPNLKDITGYNYDLGMRGSLNGILTFDFSYFYLLYNNRIGIDRAYKIDAQTVVNYRTNIGQSVSTGYETFAELNFSKLLGLNDRFGEFSTFSSISNTDARYTQSTNKLFLGKRVEYAPEWIKRFGMSYKLNKFSIGLQYSSVSNQFTEASNASIGIDGGVNGPIPEYHTLDLSMNFSINKYSIGAGINNLSNQVYFTRRTNGFPGPGIIPSDPRSYYITLGINLNKDKPSL